MSTIDFTEFAEMPFPERRDIVYVICFKARGADTYTPYYVGESTRSVGRFWDYDSAQFGASTDFKVGRASRRMLELGCEIVIRYKATSDRKTEENALIRALRDAGTLLLNDLAGYDPKVANKEEELQRVVEFAERLALGSIGNERIP